MDNEKAVAIWNKRLGWLVLATAGFTAVTIALLHVLRPDLDPFDKAISEYVNGPYGFLMTVTFFSQSLGSLALAAILMREGRGQRRIRIGGALFIIAAVGGVVAGVFPADPASPYSRTTSGAIHMAAGLARFLALSFALPLLSSALAKHPHFEKVAKVLTLFGVLFVVTFLVSVVVLANVDLFGIGQRTFIAVLLIWMSTAVYPVIRRPES
jgi:hypothetical membrane protein